MIQILARRQCLLAAVLVTLVALACADESGEATKAPWKNFVRVAGQPEPIPAQWVSTPQGQFAHSIVIPNPLPDDSGYQPWMTSKQYFDHLCNVEAGEFIFKTVPNVKGFYFMRPPHRPTDADLMDRFKLEAPDIERTFQLVGTAPQERAAIFVAPPFNRFTFVELPTENPTAKPQEYLRAWGYRGGSTPMKVSVVNALESTYGVTWRGIRRPKDRELAIAGSEWIVIDLRTNEVLAVMRNYGRSGMATSAKGDIWWLNALSCPVFASRYKSATSERIYNFVSAILIPPDVHGPR